MGQNAVKSLMVFGLSFASFPPLDMRASVAITPRSPALVISARDAEDCLFHVEEE